MIVTYALSGSLRRAIPSGNDTSSTGSSARAANAGAAAGRSSAVVDEHGQPFQILRTHNHVNRLRTSQNLRSFLLRHAACTQMRFAGWGKRSSAKSTATSSISMRKLPERTPTKIPDANLSRCPLHHGRVVGGLPADVHRSRAFCGWRSKLLRSWRQPAGRQRPDAGFGGWIFHPALYLRELHRFQPI